ncbi:MAG: hypothetical protein ABFS14_11510 [Gemmatimonadota bacterium]
MNKSLAGLVAAGALASAVAGCGPRVVDVSGDGAAGAADVPRTRVVVQNRSTLDVEIYALRITERFHLGLVVTNAENTFRLPAHLQPPFRDLRILVDPVGTRNTYESDPIIAGPGETIEVRVVSTLEQTSVIVR